MLSALLLAGAPFEPAQQNPKKKVPASGIALPSDGGNLTPEIETALAKGDMTPLIEILSTSDGGFPFAKYKWQVPDLESYVDVPAVQVVNGLPVRFSAAVSRHDIPFLMDYYAKEFVHAGLFIPPPDDFKRLGLGEEFFQLTALDTDNLISYTVMFQPTGPNQTTVIMSQGYLQEWLKKKSADNAVDFVPMFPNAKMVVRTHSEGVEMINYSVEGSPDDVMNFYKATLARSGYIESPEEKAVYVRGAERIKVRAAKVPKPRPGVPPTAVMIERRASAGP